MSMVRSLFRPGSGQTIRHFTAAVAEEVMYPHDWVSISGTAPGGLGPGSDGVFEGKTLGDDDYIYVELADSALDGVPGLELGVCMGASIHSVSDITDVSGDVLAAHDVIIVQMWGVHPMVQTDGAASPTVEYLTIGTAAGTADASGTIGPSDHSNVGIVLETDIAYTRAVAETGSVAWIRCY